MMGRDYFCSTVSGPHLGRPSWLGWLESCWLESSRGFSPPMSGMDTAAGLRRIVDQSTCTWLLHVAWASYRMVTGFLREHPKREHLETEHSKAQGRNCKASSDLPLEVIPTLLWPRLENSVHPTILTGWCVWGDSKLTLEHNVPLENVFSHLLF